MQRCINPSKNSVMLLWNSIFLELLVMHLTLLPSLTFNRRKRFRGHGRKMRRGKKLLIISRARWVKSRLRSSSKVRGTWSSARRTQSWQRNWKASLTSMSCGKRWAQHPRRQAANPASQGKAECIANLSPCMISLGYLMGDFHCALQSDWDYACNEPVGSHMANVGEELSRPASCLQHPQHLCLWCVGRGMNVPKQQGTC